MVKKLTYLLTNRIGWRLLGRGVLFGLLLYLSVRSEFNGWALLLFFGVLAVLYYRELPERASVRGVYWLIPLLSLLLLGRLALAFPDPAVLLLGAAALSALFVALLDTANFLFPNRRAAYSLLHTLLLFLAALYAFSFEVSVTWGPPLFLFLATALLFRDAFAFFGVPAPRRAWVLAGGAGLLAVEVGFFLSLLPLGFMNAAALLALSLFLVRDAFLASLRGTLDLPFVLRELAFLVFLTVAAFAASRWTL